ncbi:hypothetical protein HWV62_2308 [Athelia sp. TMB]|nr:hypothetical protein HWV62_2308 [Athelia sp. TMB]
MRAEKDRLLAIPDFAGLSKREKIRAVSPPRPRPALKRRDAPSPALTSQMKKPKSRYSSNDSHPPWTSESTAILRSPFLLSKNGAASSKNAETSTQNSSVLSTLCKTDDSTRKTDYLAHEADSSPYDDSGYAESLHGTEQHKDSTLANNNADGAAYSHYSSRAGSFERDSSILNLDTSPPTSSAPFQTIIDFSQRSSSSPFNPYLSAPFPTQTQQRVADIRPTVLSPGLRNESVIDKHREPPPSSMADPPPPTFCMPSPPRKPLILFEASRQDNLDVRYPLLSSPSPLSLQSPRKRILPINLLDEEDPWEALGKYMNLKLPSSRRGSSPQPHQTLARTGSAQFDRRGVGYRTPPEIKPIVDEGDVVMGLPRSSPMTASSTEMSSPRASQSISSSPHRGTMPDSCIEPAFAEDLSPNDVMDSTARLVDCLCPASPSLYMPTLALHISDTNPNTENVRILGPCLFSDSDNEEGE